MTYGQYAIDANVSYSFEPFGQRRKQIVDGLLSFLGALLVYLNLHFLFGKLLAHFLLDHGRKFFFYFFRCTFSGCVCVFAELIDMLSVIRIAAVHSGSHLHGMLDCRCMCFTCIHMVFSFQ